MTDSRAADWRLLVGSEDAWAVEAGDFEGGRLQVVQGDRTWVVVPPGLSFETDAAPEHTLVASLDALPLRSGAASFAHLDLRGSARRERRWVAGCFAEQYRLLDSDASACFVLMNAWTTPKGPGKRGAGGFGFYRRLADSVGFHSITAWAPLPRPTGVPLAIVSLSSTAPLRYLLRLAGRMATTVSPEVRRDHRIEYVLATGLARVASYRPFVGLVRYLVPSFLLVVSKRAPACSRS